MVKQNQKNVWSDITDSCTKQRRIQARWRGLHPTKDDDDDIMSQQKTTAPYYYSHRETFISKKNHNFNDPDKKSHFREESRKKKLIGLSTFKHDVKKPRRLSSSRTCTNAKITKIRCITLLQRKCKHANSK